MKNYKMLPKLILAVRLIGSILAVVNYFTGFINATIQISSGLSGSWGGESPIWKDRLPC